MLHVVIRAGGAGSRLWPVSRAANPKQFHALTSSETMLQEAVARVQGLVRPEQIYISTGASTAHLVAEQCPTVPAQNSIIEPARKDTTAAVGLESVIIAKRDPEAIVASLGSDHAVRNTAEFQRVLKAAEAFITKHPETIVPIGIQPLHPDTGYGYIQFEESLETVDDVDVRKVVRFTEKPDLAQAQEFLQQGNYLWNANMFVWRVSTILDLFQQHVPEMYEQLMVIQEAVDTPQQQEVIERVYPELERIAIDYAIIEKTQNIASIAANIGWNDIGDWGRLKDEVAGAKDDTVAMNVEHIGIDSKDLLVYREGAKKIVATIGLEHLVIVDTDDVLLVARNDRTQEVKKIVEQLEDQKRSELL